MRTGRPSMRREQRTGDWGRGGGTGTVYIDARLGCRQITWYLGGTGPAGGSRSASLVELLGVGLGLLSVFGYVYGVSRTKLFQRREGNYVDEMGRRSIGFRPRTPPLITLLTKTSAQTAGIAIIQSILDGSSKI
jgi:hypothetical protein